LSLGSANDHFSSDRGRSDLDSGVALLSELAVEELKESFQNNMIDFDASKFGEYTRIS
jgi:hypothetical protein